jgi:hypothetical protein
VLVATIMGAGSRPRYRQSTRLCVSQLKRPLLGGRFSEATFNRWRYVTATAPEIFFF